MARRQKTEDVDAEYRLWAEYSGSMISRHSLDGTIQYVSPACRAILGYEPHEIIGRSLGDLLFAETSEMLVRDYGKVPRRPGPSTARMRMKRKDGSAGWVETIGLVADYAEGPSPQIVSVTRDISDQQDIEDQLVRQHALLNAIVENAPAMIVVYDPAGRLAYLNSAVTATLGWTASDFATLDPIAACYPDLDEQRRVRELLVEPPPGFVDLQPLSRDGKKVETAWTNVRLSDGTIVSIGIDITARKAAEDALRRSETRARSLNAELAEANARKDEFLAVLAHELRNPLAPIVNAAEAMKRMSLPDRDLAKARDLIAEKSWHMVRLVDDLLDLSRVRYGAIRLRREVVALAGVLTQAISTSRPAIDARGHRFVRENIENELHVRGDLVRLVQVLSNLMNNAARFTEPGGEVRVVTEREGDLAVVRVVDSGIGIAAVDLPRIFDLFFQAHRSPGSMGIGLGLARTIVELHGGSISARSAGPGCGSEFVVRLPVAQASLEPQPAGINACPLAQRRILVVDDDEAVADGLALLLRTLGQEVRVALDGTSALKTLETFAPNLVFIDLGMPGMDGYEVAEKIRELRSGRDARLVALTGYARGAVEARIRSAGFDAYVAKPADITELEALLR